MDRKYFWCSNDGKCAYHTMQPLKNVAQELEHYKLCFDCFSKRYRLRYGVTIQKIDKSEFESEQRRLYEKDT